LRGLKENSLRSRWAWAGSCRKGIRRG
jgi:hypothetical protein